MYYFCVSRVRLDHVFLYPVVQDGVHYFMHRLKHVVYLVLYCLLHKPHHKFTNSKLFDAFDRSNSAFPSLA